MTASQPWNVLLAPLLLASCGEPMVTPKAGAPAEVAAGGHDADVVGTYDTSDAPAWTDAGDAAGDRAGPDGGVASQCPQGRGPVMVRVPWPAERGGGLLH